MLKNKKNILIAIFLFSTLTLLAETNPLSQYVNEEDYEIGLEKFGPEKNLFKERVIDRSAINADVINAQSRINSTFTKVLTTINSKNVWDAVIYYNDINKGTQNQRLIISGRKSIRIDGYLYTLSVYESGVRVRDARTGNIYNLEVKGR